jgi:hypothetical protein
LTLNVLHEAQNMRLAIGVIDLNLKHAIGAQSFEKIVNVLKAGLGDLLDEAGKVPPLTPKLRPTAGFSFISVYSSSWRFKVNSLSSIRWMSTARVMPSCLASASSASTRSSRLSPLLSVTVTLS